MLGQSLLHYQITAKLGQGGMGEVYCATDTKLDREVAIKVLPLTLDQNMERLARFEREAKVLAQLSHPNIATVHGFEESDGTCFLVMEHVEGEDLSVRLRRGPLSIEESIDVGRQVAEALETAHGKGIIHRDLKPANIKMTAEGRVKVLDFGLAKALEGDSDSVGQASSRAESAEGDGSRGRSPHQGVSFDESPTITDASTRPGTILGTAAYMSPEQARGKGLDQRTDVWSFGCVLYECLTGDCLFKGETGTDSIAAVLQREPDWKQLAPKTPASVVLLLRRCLVKDRERRLSEIRQARLELEDVKSDPVGVSLVVGTGRGASGSTGRRGYGIGSIALAVVVSGLVTAGLLLTLPKQGEKAGSVRSERPSKFHLDLAEIVHHHTRTRTMISPDGEMILYQWGGELRKDLTRQRDAGLALKFPDELVAKKLPLTNWAPKPFWSPDGREIGYFGADELLRVSVSGDKPIPVAPLPSGWPAAPFSQKGGVWLPSGEIFFVSGKPGQSAGLWQVTASGGAPRLVVEVDDDESAFLNPSPLPGGRGLLFLVGTTPVNGVGYGVYSEIRAFAEGSWKTVLELPGESIASVVCDPKGYLIYDRITNQPGLWALPFSFEELKVTGDPFFVAAGTDPSLSNDGKLLYLDGTEIHSPSAHELVWLTGNGQFETIGDMPRRPVGDARLSNDETQALVGARSEDGVLSSIWWQDLRRPGIERQLTHPPAGSVDLLPAWDSDEQHFYFRRCSDVLGRALRRALLPGSIIRHRLDGRGEPTEVIAESVGLYSVSSDSQVLVYGAPASDGTNRRVIAYIDLHNSDASPTILPLGPADVINPSVSPDGRFLAYARADAEGYRCYVTDFPSCRRSVQVVRFSVSRVYWSKADSPLSLFLLDRTGSTLFRVPVTLPGNGGDFEFGDRDLVYNANDSNLEHFWVGDVSNDGSRFLVPRQVGYEIDENRRVVMVEDWLAEFQDKMPFER